MRLAFLIVGMLMFVGSAYAQKVISDYDTAASIARNDKLLLQQGDRTTPYTYGTPDQLFAAMSAADVTAALNFSPLPSTGGTLSGSLTISGIARLNGGIIATSLPTSCSSQPTGTVWNNGNVLSICP